MKGKVKKAVKQDRYNRLMECQQFISREINESRIGEIYDVLVEGVSDDGIFYYGRSYAEGPDVDGKIYFTANDPLSAGDMVKVKILIAEEYDLTGCQI
jgi:ribosomal protein S12 methylthiotransferase